MTGMRCNGELGGRAEVCYHWQPMWNWPVVREWSASWPRARYRLAGRRQGSPSLTHIEASGSGQAPPQLPPPVRRDWRILASLVTTSHHKVAPIVPWTTSGDLPQLWSTLPQGPAQEDSPWPLDLRDWPALQSDLPLLCCQPQTWVSSCFTYLILNNPHYSQGPLSTLVRLNTLDIRQHSKSD